VLEASGWTPQSISIVVPVFNEEENAEPLVRSIEREVRPLGLPFEVVIIDDGSQDGTIRRLRALVPSIPELVVVCLRRNFGQTLALQAGFDRARGDVVVTMDGDLQNDPRDIPRLLEEISRGADVVSGWRRERKDTLVLRKLPSWVANRLIRWVTGVPIHDQGCSLKAYRAEVLRGLDLYGDMHRFIAVLTMPLGARIREIEVTHHPRVAGTSKYGISRVLKVLSDLFSIQMLTRFRENPLRWFGTLGLPFLAAALIAALAAIVSWPRTIVMPAIMILCGLSFLSCVFYGLLGEAIIESAGRNRAGRTLYRCWGGEH
jgi:glycosyltransferase involved in cell wall biosynthesis